MKKILLCSLAVAGVFGAASANAATTITSTEVQSFAKAVSDYIVSNNYVISGATTSDMQLVAQIYGDIATTPSAQINPWVSTTNSTLQSSAACAGMGTFSSANYNENNLSLCLSDVIGALSSSGATSSSASLAGALGVLKAAGVPFTIPGTSTTVASTSAATTPTISTAIAKTVTETISTAVTPQIQRATSVQQASIISNVISNIFSSRAPNAPGAPMRMSLGNEKGMAAGNAPTKLNAWVNASDTTIGSSASASLFDGYVTNAIGGVDYRVSDKFVAGVSAGYDRVALNFKFAGLTNSGLVSTGWMVAPYASYQISDLLSVDGAYGYAEGDVDTRTYGVIATQNYDRNFFALNLNANYWISDWQLTGKANYIAAEENVATTNKMEQLRLGGQVGYWTKGIMPYASLTYVRDLKVSTGGIQPASLDDDAWVASVGVNLFSKGALSGGISYTEEFDRADSKNYTFTANIGYRF